MNYLYHKVFKSNADMSTFLENKEPLIEVDEEFFNRLIQSRNQEELRKAKLSILRDFWTIYEFDVKDAELPDPIGYFGSVKEKNEFIKNKILVHDIVLYLGNVIFKYHKYILERSKILPEIELQKLNINYNELYKKALEDYIESLKNKQKQKHAITASFIMPTIIEQGLAIDLQNRLLYKSLSCMPNAENLMTPLDKETMNYIRTFFEMPEKIMFYASEEHVMSKIYEAFVRESVIKATSDNEMILTGIWRAKNRKGYRTLGRLLNAKFTQDETCQEYYRLMHSLFIRLNIRNCIMHGIDETFDYFNIQLTAIMFQLAWDIADCSIFNDDY